MLHRHPRATMSDASTRKKTIATYSKNHPVQSAKKEHFLTPDTPEIDWIPPSKAMNSKQGRSKRGTIAWDTPTTRRGSTLALRNISNIPMEKNLSQKPCIQQTRKSNRRLPVRSSLATKVSSMDNKDCKIYKAEIQRSKNFKKSEKSKVSTTTYLSKSMSCCSVCGGIACSSGRSVSAKPQCVNGHSLSTIKSMTLCHSLDDLDLSLGESQVMQPHNSTFIEEDVDVELKDIFPQDLSAILEEPVDKEQTESPKKSRMDPELSKMKTNQKVSSAPYKPACCVRCSTPTDPENVQPLNAATLSVSPIQATEKICAPVVNKSTDLAKPVCPELDTNAASDPDITPQTGSKKDCTSNVKEPKQKRKLAYWVNKVKVPDCILLDVVVNKKKPVKIFFKKEENNSWPDINPSSFPVDILS